MPMPGRFGFSVAQGIHVFRRSPVTPPRRSAVSSQEVNWSSDSAVEGQLVLFERMVRSEAVAPNVGASADKLLGVSSD
jgi:hypothetical protein